MKVRLQHRGLLLERTERDDSINLNEWFNDLGHELQGHKGQVGMVLNARVLLTRRDGPNGVQISFYIEREDDDGR